jgi:hypothetical protein
MCIEGRKGLKIDAAKYVEVFEASSPWPEVRDWKRYSWRIVRDVPVMDLEHSTREEYAMDPDSDDEESGVERVDQIVALLGDGAELWPVVMGVDCMIVDGYHRLTAAEELGIKVIDVIYPIKQRIK